MNIVVVTLKLQALTKRLALLAATEMWERLPTYKEHHCTEGVARGLFFKAVLLCEMPPRPSDASRTAPLT